MDKQRGDTGQTVQNPVQRADYVWCQLEKIEHDNGTEVANGGGVCQHNREANWPTEDKHDARDQTGRVE